LTFANLLAQLQAEHKETNYMLAKSLGVHQTTVKNWRQGTMPHPAHMRLIEEHFGVSVDELLKADKEGA
jgi:hypothetical protein